MIENLSYKEIIDSVDFERKQFDELRSIRLEKRAQLSAEEREELDRHFLSVFHSVLMKNSKKGELEILLNKGGSTTYFGNEKYDESIEAYKTKFSTYLSEFLTNEKALFYFKNQTKEELETTQSVFQMCIEAGDSFFEKELVGHHEDSSIYELFDFLGEKENNHEVIVPILYKMIVTSEGNKYFLELLYDHLLLFIQAINYRLTVTQEKLIKFLAIRFINGETFFLLEYLNGYGKFKKINKAFFKINYLLDDLFFLADKKKGNFDNKELSDFCNNKLQGEWRNILGIFLSSKSSRVQLIVLLKSSSWLRDQFIKNSDCFFSLVRGKEIGIIEIFLNKESSLLLSLRNREGDNLLTHLCQAQGRIDKLVRILVKAGFDPCWENKKGETSIEIAHSRNLKKVLEIF